MLAAEANWYASGIAADNHRPSTAYVKTHTEARLAIKVEDSVRTALRTRSSSESDGTVPIAASPATQPGSRHVLQRGPRWLTTATISRPLDERSQRSPGLTDATLPRWRPTVDEPVVRPAPGRQRHSLSVAALPAGRWCSRGRTSLRPVAAQNRDRTPTRRRSSWSCRVRRSERA